MKIEHKSVPVSGFKVLDEDEGVIEAIVSVTGIVDEVGDIIEPGAYEKTLKVRTPKGVRSHDWTEPVSKTQSAEELMPGDPRLPEELPNGEKWPDEAGALLVKTQYNLETQRGREAYADVKFFADEQEWSIGYNVPKGKYRIDSKSGIRKIQEIDLYEYSDVLFGAMPNARTVTGVKDAQLQHMAIKAIAAMSDADTGEDAQEKASVAVREITAELEDEGVTEPEAFHEQFQSRLRERLGITVEATDDGKAALRAAPESEADVAGEDGGQEPVGDEQESEVDDDPTDDGDDDPADDDSTDDDPSDEERLVANVASILESAGVDEKVIEQTRAALTPEQSKAFVTLAGSYEQRIDNIRRAIAEELADSSDSDYGPYVDIEATFDQRVVVNVYGDGGRTMYEYAYVVNDDDTVTLGTAREVEVRGVVVGKSLHGREAKAGRVLSRANASRLKNAISELQTILEDAGDDAKAADDELETKDGEPDGNDDEQHEDGNGSSVHDVADPELMLLEHEQAKALLDT